MYWIKSTNLDCWFNLHRANNGRTCSKNVAGDVGPEDLSGRIWREDGEVVWGLAGSCRRAADSRTDGKPLGAQCASHTAHQVLPIDHWREVTLADGRARRRGVISVDKTTRVLIRQRLREAEVNTTNIRIN